MLKKPFGNTGVEVPVIGQGTWHMGESRRARRAEVVALQAGLELGLTHVDTAEMYASGGAEEVVAAAIRGRRREELFLVSKVLPENASRAGTIMALERSLRRLGTDYLDLYLLHWESRYPIGETMGAMEDLVTQGKLRFCGVSNFGVEKTRQAKAALTRERLACNQVLYNLRHRGVEVDLLPFCQREGIALVGYTPLGGLPAPGSAGWDLLAGVAKRHGRSVRQVVLQFLIRLPGLFTIPKAARVEHVRENAAAADFTLTAADLAAIDRAFPAPQRPVPLAMN